jgi:signal transduction histidine kinase
VAKLLDREVSRNPGARARERIRHTERIISYIRLGVVLFNIATYLSWAPDSSRRPLALAICVLAPIYALWTVWWKPRTEGQSDVMAFGNMILDNLLITLWLFATGGFASPFYPLYYAEAAASTGRFGRKVGLVSAAGSGLLYLLLLVADGGAPIFETSVRIAYIFVIAAFVAHVTEVARDSLRETLEAEVATAEAELTADTYREMDRLRSTFVANVSHELRTPLTAIRGAASTLARCGPSLELAETQALLGMLDRQSAHLASLVQDIIDVGLAEQGRLIPEFSWTDVTALVTTEVEATRALASHTIAYSPTPGEILAFCDGPKIANALRKILDNATKFSARDSVIAVDLQHDEREINVIVTDQGSGISEVEIGRIFDRFHQIDSSFTREVDGAGIGLTIARSVVEQHGGRIDVASAPGAGSRFTIKLPTNGSNGATPSSAAGTLQSLEAAVLAETGVQASGSGRDVYDAEGPDGSQ